MMVDCSRCGLKDLAGSKLSAMLVSGDKAKYLCTKCKPNTTGVKKDVPAVDNSVRQ